MKDPLTNLPNQNQPLLSTCPVVLPTPPYISDFPILADPCQSRVSLIGDQSVLGIDPLPTQHFLKRKAQCFSPALATIKKHKFQASHLPLPPPLNDLLSSYSQSSLDGPISAQSPLSPLSFSTGSYGELPISKPSRLRLKSLARRPCSGSVGCSSVLPRDSSDGKILHGDVCSNTTTEAAGHALPPPMLLIS